MKIIWYCSSMRFYKRKKNITQKNLISSREPILWYICRDRIQRSTTNYLQHEKHGTENINHQYPKFKLYSESSNAINTCCLNKSLSCALVLNITQLSSCKGDTKKNVNLLAYSPWVAIRMKTFISKDNEFYMKQSNARDK